MKRKERAVLAVNCNENAQKDRKSVNAKRASVNFKEGKCINIGVAESTSRKVQEAS